MYMATLVLHINFHCSIVYQRWALYELPTILGCFLCHFICVPIAEKTAHFTNVIPCYFISFNEYIQYFALICVIFAVYDEVFTGWLLKRLT